MDDAPALSPPSQTVGGIARVGRPLAARHGSAFTALRIGGAILGREGDPFLNVDHFKMGGPTFPPHAHAGFSAITYMLPESAAGMRNRDSLGDRRVIAQGGLHWTAAGSGIVHEEVPDRPAAIAEGLQIFVRQPVAQERAAPLIHHVAPEAVPVLALGPESRVRILAGSFGGRTAQIETPTPLDLLDIALEPGATIDWHTSWPSAGCVLYVMRGSLDVGGRTVTAPDVVVFGRGVRSLTALARNAARFVLMAGEPVDAPSFSNGPFVLSSQTALDDAVERYRSGAMGTLT